MASSSPSASACPTKPPTIAVYFRLLECQAEGDRVLRLDIHIDWVKPSSQRIVDGLLVAQRNPEPAHGLYQQSNAESTRIFGNPHGCPDQVEIDHQRAPISPITCWSTASSKCR